MAAPEIRATSTAPARLWSMGSVATRTVAEAAVFVQVVLGAAVVLAAAERRSVLTSVHHGAFTDWFAGPLRGLLPWLTRDSSVLQRDLRVALFAMVAAWLAVVLTGNAARPRVVIGAVVALHVLFLFCPPFELTDIFNYIGYARLDAVHHLNPYVQLPLAAPSDPSYAYSNWHGLRSPYGPLFTLLLLPIAKLPLPAAYWTYKVIATVASLGLLAAVWACARRLGRAPAPAVSFVGLNPILLVYTLGGQHDELLMMACVMAGALLVLARREAFGGVTLAASAAITASAAFLAPVVVLGAPRRPRAIAGAVVGALVFGAVSLLAFGPHLPDLRQQDRLVTVDSFPNLIGFAIGRGGADAGVRTFMTGVAVVGVIVCAAVAWRSRRWATPAGWAGLIGVVCTSWLVPWYVLWALPFAALSRSRALRGAAMVMTAWLILFTIGLGTTIEHHLGIHPERTAVARANHRYLQTLLSPHPSVSRRANRNPTSRQPSQTAIP